MAEKQSNKRQTILDASLILFTDRGFHGTPTSLIAKEAGVATGTLFHYFKTKEELIDTLYLEIKKESGSVLEDAASCGDSCREKLDNVSNALADWGLDNPRKIYFMQQFCYSPYISSTAQEEGVANFAFLTDLIRTGIKEGWLRDYPPELIRSIVSSALMDSVLMAARESDPRVQREVLKQSIELVLHGIVNE
ncbi:TetR/AcrR family transcriptional regulator [Methanolobus profundi]|uniref:DNA-binding transcriptional regulator, AcrR family n=1 Tax=Methanolobus profundi TaxID=487685 RepID=A0A1I4TPT6_9EURY|nr:TetR/AcrR family transcriptional regulator [Methanolobus profundi]SFM78577.1 DNA-binding transcriptional regulator, AcrR family [Methanolobus profundi]